MQPQVVFTLFPNAKALQGAIKILSLEETAHLAKQSFSSKLAQPLAIPDQLPNDNRRAANEPIQSTSVFLDFDKPVLGYKDMHRKLSRLGLAHVIYPTFSWHKDTPKYRVVLPLGKPLQSQERRHLVARMMKVLPGIAPESLDSKRGYFLGCNGTKGPDPLWMSGSTGEQHVWPDADIPARQEHTRKISLRDNPAAKAQELFAALGRKLKDGEGRWLAVEYLATRVSAREYPEDQCHAFLNDMIARYFDASQVTPADRTKWEKRIAYWQHKDVAKRSQRLTRAEPVRIERVSPGLPDTFTLNELLDMDLPPVEWIAEGFLPPGLAILAGAPKVGKSKLALALTLAVASGKPFLGRFKCKPAHVIYLDLESGHRLIKDRVQPMMLALDVGREAGGRISFSTVAERGNKALVQLKADIEANPETRLAVVDIFTAIRDVGEESSKRANAYLLEYELVKQFQDLCLNNPKLCILLVHHTKKGSSSASTNHWQEMISGTQGIAGGAHTNIVMEKPSKQGIVSEEDKALVNRFTLLHVVGKQVRDESYSLTSENSLTWEISDITPSQAAATSLQSEVLAYLKANAGMWSAPEVANALGRNTNTIKTIMLRMRRHGQISSPTGKGYCLTQASTEERAARSPKVGRKPATRH